MVAPVVTHKGPNQLTVTWSGLADDDDGDAVQIGNFSDKTVQFIGDFDGTTATIRGSNDGVNYVSLSDANGDPIAPTDVGMFVIAENPKYIDVITTGGAAPDVAVMLHCKRP